MAQRSVNGQLAKIRTVQNKTVFLAAQNGQIVNAHLVTYVSPDEKRKTVYLFAPAYATTICKAQGQGRSSGGARLGIYRRNSSSSVPSRIKSTIPL